MINRFSWPFSDENRSDSVMTLEEGRTGHACGAGCRSFPLSYEQRAMWLQERFQPGSLANHLTYSARIDDALDIPSFLAALGQVVDRHPMLRATFDELDGIPFQTAHSQLPAAFVLESGDHWTDDNIAAYLAAGPQAAFDLQHGPLGRFFLFSRSEREHVLVFHFHHLIADMWSLALILSELTAIYRSLVTERGKALRPATSTYEDFVEAEHGLVGTEEGAEHLAFWRDQLAGFPEPLGFRTDYKPRSTTGRGRRSSVTVDAGLTRALKDLASSSGASLQDVVVAAFLTVLHRHTAQDDVVAGYITANRSLRRLGVVGCFVNPVALRANFSDDPTFEQVVGRVRDTLTEASKHKGFPWQKVVEELHLAGEGGQRPYLQTMFSWDRTTRAIGNLAQSSSLGAEAGPTVVNSLPLTAIATEPAAPNEVMFRAAVIGHELAVSVEFNVDLFGVGRMERFLGHFWGLLAGAVADPGCRVGALPLLSVGELGELEGWAGSVGGGGGSSSVVGLFEERVGVDPGAVAVRFGHGCVSFGELNERANRLARHLVGLGVGTGSLVGVWLERSLDMVVAVLAVEKAGGAFVPLDPGFPPDRLEFMVSDSGARVVVTQAGLLAEGDLGSGLEYVCVDRDAALIGEYSGEDLGVRVSGDDVAYVIYTSGSTGRPKGVQVGHRNLANLLEAMAKRPGLAPGDVVLSVTTLSFDISLLELFLPLVVGAEVVVVRRQTAADGVALAEELSRSGATMMQATPSTWRMLIEAGWTGDGRLKALCGGEAMSRDLADQLLARCGSVWNMYGPTETTIWSAVAEVAAGEGPVPIGEPIGNTRLYVLDGHRQLVPMGVPGELFIGGDGVARGYLGRPELTAERFVDDPFGTAPGARMYRTGDLVCRRADGEIEFLGRVDSQLKVRGYRIEAEEVESVLVEHPDVARAVVVAHEHGRGDMRLVAYVNPTRPGVGVGADQLRIHLQAKLPGYMVPAAYMSLAAFPTTPNNKIDRARLPNPDARTVGTASSEPPRPGLETDWPASGRTCSESTSIGRHDDFFDLGGHSLLATQIVSRVRSPPGCGASGAERIRSSDRRRAGRRGGCNLPIDRRSSLRWPRRAPRSPTAHIRSRSRRSGCGSSSSCSRTDRPTTCAGAVRLRGPLDVARPGGALNQLVARHESCVRRSCSEDGAPRQRVLPELSGRAAGRGLPLGTLRRRGGSSARSAPCAGWGAKPFDLERPPLFRFGCTGWTRTSTCLLLCLHHIISDNWSFGVLSRELAAFYRAEVAGRPARPARARARTRGLRAGGIADWLESGRLASQLEYWKAQLDGLPVTELPTDRPRPPVQTDRGATSSAPIPARAWPTGCTALCRERASPFMVMLAAFDALLHRYTGADDIVVGVPDRQPQLAAQRGAHRVVRQYAGHADRSLR